jgi:hypothetical protein
VRPGTPLRPAAAAAANQKEQQHAYTWLSRGQIDLQSRCCDTC